MSIKVGGIDLTSSVINTELRLGILEKIVQQLANYAPPGALNQELIERFRRETFEEMQNKYPDAGLTYTRS